ncbi:MAG: alpha/beta hydrolase [Spirochaetia bacterium]|nr:alpha/beta hydrolase [Spirochaetia bacterium]
MSFSKGLEFVARSQLKRFRAVSRTTISIPIKGETLKTYVYAGGNRGTIVLVHGMALRGIDDPRMEVLGQSFASLGFTVYAPLFPEIANLVISTESWRKVSQVVRFVSEKVNGRVALFSASFSAGIALVAACGDEKNRISAVCTVGTLGSVDTTLDFLIGQQGIDDYGTMVVLWNFLKVPASVREAFRIAAADNGLERDPPELPGYLSKLKKADRELFNRIRSDRDFRLTQWKKFTATKQFQDLRANVSPSLHMKHVPFQVTLIHGEEDNVIPPSESASLHKEFLARGVRSRLGITPLISHGHGSIGLSAIPEAMKLASAFGEFISAV